MSLIDDLHQPMVTIDLKATDLEEAHIYDLGYAGLNMFMRAHQFT